MVHRANADFWNDYYALPGGRPARHSCPENVEAGAPSRLPLPGWGFSCLAGCRRFAPPLLGADLGGEPSHLLPHHIFVVATIDERVYLAAIVSPKEHAAFDAGPKEEIACFRHQ